MKQQEEQYKRLSSQGLRKLTIAVSIYDNSSKRTTDAMRQYNYPPVVPFGEIRLNDRIDFFVMINDLKVYNKIILSCGNGVHLTKAYFTMQRAEFIQTMREQLK